MTGSTVLEKLLSSGTGLFLLAGMTLAAEPLAARPDQGPSVRILLVGDSTVTDEIGWGLGFKKRLAPGVECVNAARNGRSSRSFITEGHWKAALAQGATYVLIQFGHNDMPGKGPDRETDPATTYREFLGRYVDEARARGMTPVIVTSLTRRLFGPDGKIAADLEPYASAAREVADARKVPVVDLHARSIEVLNRLGPAAAEAFNPAKGDATPDRTHLTTAGSDLFGGIVADELRLVVPELRDQLLPGPTVRWNAILDQPEPWYGSAEARRIADNVLLYQRHGGGWPKNTDMARLLSDAERASIAADKDKADSTLDNGATTTEIRFLAQILAAGGSDTTRAGAMEGLHYLLEAQYPNGGWPQFYPLRTDYSRYITFNDGVMTRALALTRDVAGAGPTFGFVDAGTKARASAAFQRGLDLVLKTQLKVNGRLTGWCAQYDAFTLEPRGARSYEHPSIDGRETTDVAHFLMTIERPAPAVMESVERAIEWLRSVAIKGWRVERQRNPNAPGGFDRVLVADPTAPLLWARFYGIGTNQPIYSGRDGVIRSTLAKIEIERRAGYNWIDTFAATLLERDYPTWRQKQGSRK